MVLFERLLIWYFYPRSPCGERHRDLRCCPPRSHISIHALLAESDHTKGHIISLPFQFLSTLSLRRATLQSQPWCTRPWHFYPRSPCGERRKRAGCHQTITCISIHALLAESDKRQCPRLSSFPHFYPRSPCGERPGSLAEVAKYATISIHALLAESDSERWQKLDVCIIFLSTLSLRRATRRYRRRCRNTGQPFLSTLSLRRATSPYLDTLVTTHVFLSTLSLRRATASQDA